MKALMDTKAEEGELDNEEVMTHNSWFSWLLRRIVW
jgi:hypothetical protein